MAEREEDGSSSRLGTTTGGGLWLKIKSAFCLGVVTELEGVR